MSIKIEIRKLPELKAKLANVSVQTEKIVQDEIRAFGLDTVNDAKRRAPVDEGYLRQNISFSEKRLIVEVVAAARYSAYLEFGTRALAAAYVASLPPEWQYFAALFKSGSNATTQGITPHPFLLPAVEKNRDLIIKRLKSRI